MFTRHIRFTSQCLRQTNMTFFDDGNIYIRSGLSTHVKYVLPELALRLHTTQILIQLRAEILRLNDKIKERYRCLWKLFPYFDT